jgi:hypothetical protein
MSDLSAGLAAEGENMFGGRWLRLCGLLAAGLALCGWATAFEIKGGNGQFTVPSTAIVTDDLYAAARNVTIDGTIYGDAVLAGQTVTINGNVEGDLIAAGQTIIINGRVRDSARVAAQAIVLGDSGRIGKDVIAVAYSLETRPESRVQGDLGVGAYQALLAGTVDRNLRAGVGRVEISGTIWGDAVVDIGDSDGRVSQMTFWPSPEVTIPHLAPGLTLSNRAHIVGQLTYTSSRHFPLEGRVGRVQWIERPVGAPQLEPSDEPFFVGFLRSYGVYFLLGGLVLLVFPRWFDALADIVERRTLPTLGWGFVAMAAIFGAVVTVGFATGFLAATLSALTLFSLTGLTIVSGTLLVGVLITVTIAFVGILAQAFAAYVGARWVLRRTSPYWAAYPVVPLALGLVVLVLLRELPWVGGLLGFAAAVFALGALWIWAREQFRPGREAMALTATEPPQTAAARPQPRGRTTTDRGDPS